MEKRVTHEMCIFCSQLMNFTKVACVFIILYQNLILTSVYKKFFASKYWPFGRKPSEKKTTTRKQTTTTAIPSTSKKWVGSLYIFLINLERSRGLKKFLFNAFYQFASKCVSLLEPKAQTSPSDRSSQNLVIATPLKLLIWFSWNLVRR